MSVRDILLNDVRMIETVTVEVSTKFVEQNHIELDDILNFEGYLVTVKEHPKATDKGFILVLEKAF